MSMLRKALGTAAIVLIVIGLNLMILQEDLFGGKAPMAFLAGLGLGTLWLILWIAHSARQPKGSSLGILNAVVSSLIFLAICMTIYAFIKREDHSWDLTQEGRRDLAPQTKLVLQSMTNPVSVTCFFVRAGDERIRVAQEKTERFLEECQQLTDVLDVEFVDPVQNPERLMAMNLARVSEVGTVVLKSGVRQRVIPLSDINARLDERTFINALLNVSVNAKPKVYFLTGHGERDLTNPDPQVGGTQLVEWIQREAYDVDQCAIPIGNPTLPEDCDVLIINGYSSDLRSHEIQALDQFIEDGGRLLLMVNAYLIEESTASVQEQLRPWISNRLGIDIGSDVILSNATGGGKILFLSDFTALGELADDVFVPPDFRGSFNGQHPITRDLDQQIVLEAIRSVSVQDELPEGVAATVLLQSTPDTWAETGLQGILEGAQIVQDADEVRGPNPVMVAATARSRNAASLGERKPEARVIVLGDADITSNQQFAQPGNQNLILNSLAWLTENEDLIAIRPSGQLDQPIILTTKEQRLIAWIAALGTVQIVTLVGIVVYFMRRKYR